MTASRVLITGASGFVGGATARALAAAPLVRLRLMVHRTPPPLPADGPVEHVTADLTDPGSLAGALDGIGTVLHLASHVSDDGARCEAINALGTATLVAQAREAGVARIVYLSTAAVYGWAIHRDAREDQVRVAPATAVSRSRAGGERAVLDAGGIVLRPLFVYGQGDTRFVPAVVRAVRNRPFLVARGAARISVVAVDDLAADLRDLALLPTQAPARGAYHVTDGHPVRFRDLVAALAAALGFEPPRHSLPYPLARVLLALTGMGGMTAPKGSSAAHRLFLVARDHVYSDARLRTLLGPRSCRPFVERIGESADWYARFLRADQPPA